MISMPFILLLMFFMHIVDDYYLQGILASMKQKSWWEKQDNYSDKYKNDYKVALIMHAFSWAFCIMLPIAIQLRFQIDMLFISVFVSNFICHAIVDNMKANQKCINLVMDQSLHIIQICMTFLIFFHPMQMVVAS